MYLAKEVFPPPSCRPRKHWWQAPRVHEYESTLDTFSRALVACENLRSLVYYSRQRRTSYRLPPQLKDDQLTAPCFTIAACMLETLSFADSLAFIHIQHFTMTGCGIGRPLPHLPKLRTLTLAKMRIDKATLSGSLFLSDEGPQTLERLELLMNDEDIVSVVVEFVLPQTWVKELVLVGQFESAALGRVFAYQKVLTATTQLKTSSRGAFSLNSMDAKTRVSVRSLVIMRFPFLTFFPEEPAEDLTMLADWVESGRCPALKELTLHNGLFSSQTELADTINLNRLELFCANQSIRLKLTHAGELRPLHASSAEIETFLPDEKQNQWVQSRLAHLHEKQVKLNV